MNRKDIFSYILILFILIILLQLLKDSDIYNLKCIKSDLDGNKYCVRDRNDIKSAVDMLAKINIKLKKLITYCSENYSNVDCIKIIVRNYNPKRIAETLPSSIPTAYSKNKGEKIAFCLNKDKNNNNDMIDENTLTFVALHELSHLGTTDIGHTDEFWKVFKFLLKQSVKINIYNPIDYNKDPKNYCGMMITDNPYYL